MKRLIDIVFSLFVLMLFLAPSLIIAILIKIESKGSVLYWSLRIGKDGMIFEMPKFRSMTVDTPEVETNKLLSPENYLTRVGAILRKTSLDEVPQFFSVLKGDMSIVGPRPALCSQQDLNHQRKKYGIDKLKPGITGWAQVNGRDDMSLSQKTAFDLEYLERQNLFFDLKVIIKTVGVILAQKNITH